MKFTTIATFLALATAMTACSAVEKEKAAYKQAEADIKKPVNCGTAEGDIRGLQSEKIYTGKQVANGILAVIPISLIEGIVTGTEGKRIKMATGDYNKKLDEKIAEIKKECNVTS
ncbi:MAG: hypothetical protein V7723_08600 [Sneathiella sp.]|uniref:hypothetical protein n=1 Tax=Sneathiella sp. TaxID=1964365 RepID=UPI003002077F